MTDKEMVDEAIANIVARQVNEAGKRQRERIATAMLHALMTDPRNVWMNKAFQAVELADELIVELNRDRGNRE